MLRTIVITEDSPVARAIESLALETEVVQVSKTVDTFPGSAYDVARALTQYDPELVVLHAKTPEQALEVGLLMRSQSPAVGVIVVCAHFPDVVEAPYKRAGIEFLAPPISPEMLVSAARNAIHQARPDLCRGMLLFVPAKAGNGASTVALNVASAFGQGLSKRVFLLEADLHSGILSLALSVKPKQPLIDVLHNASAMDYSLWERSVIHVQSIDLLPTDRSKKVPLPSWLNYHQLLKFAATRYDRVLVDLPEVVNDATAELVQYASAVYVVCTPDLPSLTLAEQRLTELAAKGLATDRAAIIVNRWQKSDISIREVEDLLSTKVAAVLQNDYRGVHSATMAGRAVKPESDLGKAFLNFAKNLDAPPGDADKGPSQGFGFLKAFRSSRA